MRAFRPLPLAILNSPPGSWRELAMRIDKLADGGFA